MLRISSSKITMLISGNLVIGLLMRKKITIQAVKKIMTMTKMRVKMVKNTTMKRMRKIKIQLIKYSKKR